jgi:predicted permease
MPDRRKVYSWLLKLYPARFREEYQSPMERQFQDEYREAASRGDRLLFWLRAVSDLAISAPTEIIRELKQDLEHAFTVYRSRAFSATMAVVALGLAIGASTGIFSVLNALLVRSLPFSNPEELVELRLSPFGAGNGRAAFTEWHRRSLYLQSAAAFSVEEANLMGGRDALRVKVAETSANFFQLLGTEAMVGRTFSAGEDAPGLTSVAVIGHSLWQQLYGGSSTAIGAVLHVNGMPLTIIGVAPPRFDYPGKTNVWTPTVFDFEAVPKRGAFLFQTIGRLRPGVAIGKAREMFEAEVQRSAPKNLRGDGQNRASMIVLRDQLAGPVREAGWVLAGMILFVLLTACANVAQLLLSRTAEREQELAIRAALGASRARLVQQLTTEATALTITGAALGLLVAHWTCRIATSIAPAPLTTQEYTVLDWRVLGFAATLALLLGIVFGIMPALLVGRLQPSGQMMRVQSGARDTGTRRTRAALVALQAGLTLILVASAMTMGRTFLQLLDSDLGFGTAHVVTLNVSLQGTKHRGGQAEWQYYSAALDRLRAVPGVEAAGAVSYLPLANNIYMANAFKLDSGQTIQQVVTNATMPGYFRAMGTTFLAGGDFGSTQPRQSAPGVIVNEAFARSAGLGTAILGRSVTAPWAKMSYPIVGVVSTVRFAGPVYPGSAQIYWPVQEEPPAALTLVARVPGQAEAYLARCRDAVRALDREVPLYDVMTLDERLAAVLARPKFYTTATLFLAALAVLLAAVGTYGVASYSVAQRTHEVGVRMALGASYERVRTMMLRENLVPICYGLAPGIAGAIASGRFLEHLLENARPPEPLTCIAAAVLLLFISFLASWRASARVLAIEPATAIRAD